MNTRVEVEPNYVKTRIEVEQDFEITDKIRRRLDIINFMVDEGYFKNQEEYVKAYHFIIRDNVPQWFLKDMMKYNEMKEGGNK